MNPSLRELAETRASTGGTVNDFAVDTALAQSEAILAAAGLVVRAARALFAVVSGFVHVGPQTARGLHG